jgi:formamidopyrimidine-DNA glycosylase
MPELPEVETVLRGLKPRISGRRIAAVEVLNVLVISGPPESFVGGLSGCSVGSLRRKGKALAIELQRNGRRTLSYLLIRLGMTGQVTVTAQDAPLQPHTHVRILLEGGKEEVRYRDVRRFGRLRYCTPEDLDAVWSRLGPDAPEISESEFFKASRGRRGSAKGWLLNQQIVSGLGNIYADEALFEAGIHPLSEPGRLSISAARRLHRAVRKVLKRAVALQGTSFRDYIDIEGRPGNFLSKLRVYQRTGEPCRRCGHLIRRIVISGRSSHFCPYCQPRPKRVPSARAEAACRPSKAADIS